MVDFNDPNVINADLGECAYDSQARDLEQVQLNTK